VFELLKKKSEKEKHQARAKEKKRHKTTTHIEYNAIYTHGETNEIGEKSRQEIEQQRVGASSSSSFFFKKREGEFQFPNCPIGETLPFPSLNVMGRIPYRARAFGVGSNTVVQKSPTKR